MEDIVAIVMVIIVVTVGYFFIKRRSSKNKVTRPPRPQVPTIPDHQAEKDGDVNNGKVFSSFSMVFAPTSPVTNAQRLNNGVVIATQQLEQSISEVTLGSLIKSDDGLPEPLENYKFKATTFGNFINPPKEGTLADNPVWAINHILNSNGGWLEPQQVHIIERPVSALVYLEIEAPEGYKSGVVILDLRIETGM